MARQSKLPLSLPPRLLSREQAAEYCGVSINHFLAHCPVKPTELLGSKRVWDRVAIDRWLDGNSPSMADDRWKRALENL
jgi:hypothetical protein